MQALARRYSVDSMQTFVWAARLRIPSYAAASVRAAEILTKIGYPGIMDNETPVEEGALHLHLLAMIEGEGPQPTPAIAPEPEPELAAVLEQVTIDMELLPEPAEDVPGAALPLWDAYRARKRATEADAAESEAAAPHAAEPETQDE
jgi:hypothetical protein